MKFLSLLVCLAMMLSGGYMAEDPQAASSSMVTIRDVAVYVDGEEYLLTPTVTLGTSTEGGAALMDFFVSLGEETLLPVQAKIDESGAGVLLGNSSTAYTFAPEFIDELMDGEELPDDMFTFIDEYFSSLRSLKDLKDASAEEINRASFAKLLELSGGEGEEATFEVDGVEQSGQHVAVELDSDQYDEWMSYTYGLYSEELAEMMAKLMDLLDADAPVAQTSVSGEVTYNDTCAVGTLVYHTDYITEGLSEEEAAAVEETFPSFDMEASFNASAPDCYTYDSYADYGSYMMTTTLTQASEEIYYSMSMSYPDFADMYLDASYCPMEDGSDQVHVSLMIDDEYSMTSVSFATLADEAGSSTEVFIGYVEEDVDVSVSFGVDVTGEPVVDRISEASEKVYTCIDDDMTAVSLAAMSLMGDVETLMNEESVAALIDLAGQYLGYTTVDTEETVEVADNTEPGFTAPEFSWVPEGYAMTCEYDGNFESYSIIFDSGADDDYYYVWLDVYEAYGYEDDSVTNSYYSIADGEIQPVNGEVVTTSSTVDEEFTYNSIWGTLQGHSINLYSTDPALTMEDLVKLVANMTFPE